MPTFPTRTIGAQTYLAPTADTPAMPDALRTDPVLPSSPAKAAPTLPPAEAAKQPVEVQQLALAPQAALEKPCVAGEWTSADVYDEYRLPKRHNYEDGRLTRQSKVSSGRPEGIWPEIWARSLQFDSLPVLHERLSD